MKYKNSVISNRTILLVFSILISTNFSFAYSPKAKDEAIIISGKARFTVLTPEMIRIEYSNIGIFEDDASFTILNRETETVPKFEKTEDQDFLYIKTDKLNLKYRKGFDPRTTPASPENLSIVMQHNGNEVEWYINKTDSLNLKGTFRTLDGCVGDVREKLENGLVSRSGWAVIDDSWNTARDDGSRSFVLKHNEELGYDWWAPRADRRAYDIYFMGYGSDYKKALSDFTKFAGKIPLPPDYVFGYWYSRYAPYSSADYREIMKELEVNDIPTDVMILDMDWHWNGREDCQSEGIGDWTGWSWNTNLIPDAVDLLKDIHKNKQRVALNLHPATGVNPVESPRYYQKMQSELKGKYQIGENIPWALDYADFARSFFNTVMRDHENEGVDFWWLDWQQHLTSAFNHGLGETFWCNHVYFNDMATNRPDRRPVIFHRWGGLGSHRYQIGFSGDAAIDYPTLAFQPYFTHTASNVGYTYWGHDLGGHAMLDPKYANDPELLLRWMQFGVFSPIFRSHATKHDLIERRIWKFPNFTDLRDAVNLRYKLFPYIYTMARETYDTGIGICRPMYYEHPDKEEAYTYEGQYYFGNDILVAPITSPSDSDKKCLKEIWFPEGKWYSVATHEMIEGDQIRSLIFSDKQIPYFYRQGAIIALNPDGVKRVTDKSKCIELHTVAGKNGEGKLYEDNGDNSDYETNYALTKFTHDSSEKYETITIHPRENNATGIRDSHEWAFVLYNMAPPQGVKLNGKSLRLSDWSYDKERKIVMVRTPEMPADKRMLLEIKKTDSKEIL